MRASWFAQNFSESFLLDGVPLAEDGHAGRLYEVTGPASPAAFGRRSGAGRATSPSSPARRPRRRLGRGAGSGLMGGALAAVTLATAVGAALVAGVFLGFSALVMPALARGSAAQGIAVMKRINRAAVGPGLMVPFLATSAGCAALAVVAIVDWGEPHAPWLLTGGLLYLVGALLHTGAYHQPRNLALDAVDPEGSDAVARWTRYLADWVPWNHVRSAAALAAAAALVVAVGG